MRRLWTMLQSMLLGLRVLFSPFIAIWQKLSRFLGWRRKSSWGSPRLQRTQDQVIRSMFKPLSETNGRVGPQVILRPVSVLFVMFSLVMAFLLNVLPWGALSWVPDFLAITLMFWAVREPQIVGIGIAFTAGLLMDVHDATVLGEHALAYTLLAYAAAILSRRLPAFDLLMQSLQVWPVFMLSLAVAFAVRSFFGGSFPGWVATLVAPSLAASLWPLATWLLLSPQRRPIDVDDTRPL